MFAARYRRFKTDGQGVPIAGKGTSSVTTDDALSQLGLSRGATREDIEAAYIRLAPAAHPDRGGSSDEFVRLTEARDAALRSLNESTLVPVETVRDLIGFMRDERHEEQEFRDKDRKREEARNESRRVSLNIAMTQTQRYRELRRRAAILGGVTVALTVAQVSTISKVSVFLPDSSLFTLVLIILSLWFGILVWRKTTTADNLKDSLENLTERLSERNYYLEIFYKTAIRIDEPFITDRDWYVGIGHWVEDEEMSYEYYENEEYRPGNLRLRIDKAVSRLKLWRWRYRVIRLYRFLFGYRLMMPYEVARMIGYSDFRRLLVAKGLELELIEARQVWQHERPQIVYSVVSLLPQTEDQSDH